MDNDHNKKNDMTPLDDLDSLGGKNTIELLEERAVVDKQSVVASRIVVSKHLRTKTVNIPIELVEEVLVIEYKNETQNDQEVSAKNVSDGIKNNDEVITYLEPRLSDKPKITVDGSEVSLDNGSVEIVLTRETATIQKQTYAVERVDISKERHIHKDMIDLELSHEELDINEENFVDKKLD